MTLDLLVRTAAVLTLVPTLFAGPPAPEPTALAVSQALVAAFGSDAVVDDSQDTHCQSAPAMPVAYRTDRIILRPPATMTTPTALARLAAALQAEMGAGTFTIGTPEVLEWNEPAAARLDDSPLRKVISVPVGSVSAEDVPVLRVARRLVRLDHLPAAPDYLVGPSNGPLGVWPDGGPEKTGSPGVPRPGLGAGTTVALFDSGVPASIEAKLPPRLSALTAGDAEDPDRNDDDLADVYYAVHLTAIAGIFATIVPEADVVGVRVTGPNGVATEFSAAKRMVTTLRAAHRAGAWPQVIVNSFGTAVCHEGGPNPGVDLIPLGLQLVAEAVDRHQEAVVVAAAGNRGTDKPFYPAAFQGGVESVISVGALDATADNDGNAWTSKSRTAKPASFSNYGDWVTAWAPGVDLATYHAVGLRFEPGGELIDGYAKVSGTSFAAPFVGAEIAEELARHSGSPLEAWRAVRDAGRPCSAEVGSGVAVALSSMDSRSTTPADRSLPAEC